MPYGKKGAYDVFSALKKKSPAYMKSSGFKMKGSPLKQEEVVSKTSPGPGWTKTKGTNIWSPPTGKFMAGMRKSIRSIDMSEMPTLGPKKLPV